jgi:hypothetical protein
MHKLLAGRDPVKGLDLASQPTLSRFENSVTPRSKSTCSAAQTINMPASGGFMNDAG